MSSASPALSRQAKAEWKQLQQERAEARDQALEAAADTRNLREAL